MAAPAFAAPPLLPPPEAEAAAEAAAGGCPPDDAEARSVSDVTELCRPWPVLLLPSMFGAWFGLMEYGKNEAHFGAEATDRTLNDQGLRSLPQLKLGVKKICPNLLNEPALSTTHMRSNEEFARKLLITCA